MVGDLGSPYGSTENNSPYVLDSPDSRKINDSTEPLQPNKEIELNSDLLEPPKTWVGHYKAFVGWQERSTFMRVVSFVEFPILVALYASIPSVQSKKWSRRWNAITLIGAPQVFLVGAKLDGVNVGELNIHWVMLILGPLLAAISYRYTTDRAPTNTLAMAFWMALAVLMACVWPMALADELVDCLKLVGIVLGLSPGVLGVSVLAVGNSMPDFFADIGVAREGHPRMAAAGCFGSPLFNLLVGVGLAFTIVTSRQYPEPFEMNVDDQGALGFVFLFISLVSSITILPYCGFRLTRRYGMCLMAFYCMYLLFAVLTEVKLMPPLFHGGD